MEDTVTRGIGKEDFDLPSSESYPYAERFTRQSPIDERLDLTRMPNVWKTHQVVVNPRYFGDHACSLDNINLAVTNIGAKYRVLYLEPGTWNIGTDLTIASNIIVYPSPGCILNIAAGKTLTINGPFEAGLYQVFSGTGTVTFGAGAVKEVYPQWFGATGDGVTDDAIAMQSCLDSYTNVNISGGTFDLDNAFVDVGADTRIHGDGTIIGGLTINGDGVQVSDITVQQATGLNGGNLQAGITCTDFSNLTIENVTFDVSSLVISNGVSSYKYGYKILGCTFTGDVSADALAQSISAGNVDSVEIRGNLFEQDELYRVMKLSSTGYGVAPDVVDDNYNKRGIISGNFFRGAITAGDKQIIDLYSSFAELIITDNHITTTGGDTVIICKASGATGPNTSQHRNILIANNVVITDADLTIFLITGAWGETYEDIAQNVTIVNNQITISNNSAGRGIQVRMFNRAVIANNDIYYTGTADPFYAIAVRQNEETNISGGLITQGNIYLEPDTSGNININGVSLVDHRGRGIDINGITAGLVNIGSCNFKNGAVAPIRIKDCTLDCLTIVGNIGTTFHGIEDDGGNTITEFTHTANSWDGIEELLTGAGAISILTKTTRLVTTAADALTLADGWEGQEKFIYMTTDGGDGTLTPANFADGNTITFDNVDSAHLLFSNGEWHWMGGTATVG